MRDHPPVRLRLSPGAVVTMAEDASVNAGTSERPGHAPRASGPLLLQLCVCGILGLVLTIFAINYPAGLPSWRIWSTFASLVALLGLNVGWVIRQPRATSGWRAALDWALLILSAALIFATVWMSRQSDVVYLLSIVCVQVFYRRSVGPAGLSFGAVTLVAWLAFQIAVGASTWEIVGRGSSLVVGIAFGAVAVTLVRSSTRQRDRGEALLRELRGAQDEIQAAHRKEKDLAVAEERVRLARELHDSVSQLLFSVSLYSQAASERLASGETATAAEHLRDVREAAQEALREMRLLIFELHRPSLDRGGLAGAVQARLDAVEARAGIHTELRCEGSEGLDRTTQEELYGIAREALNNTLKHARAGSVWVCVEFRDVGARLVVRDDGVGFDASAAGRGGFGLSGMRERAARIGATLQIESAPGKGTVVSVRAPGVRS